MLIRLYKLSAINGLFQGVKVKPGGYIEVDEVM